MYANVLKLIPAGTAVPLMITPYILIRIPGQGPKAVAMKIQERAATLAVITPSIAKYNSTFALGGAGSGDSCFFFICFLLKSSSVLNQPK
jgi:hypothetical protein